MPTKPGIKYRLHSDAERSKAQLLISDADQATRDLQIIFQQSGQLSPRDMVARLSDFVRTYPGLIDGHEHLSRYLFDGGEFLPALEVARQGLEIGYRAIGDFEGKIPWTLPGNQPLLRTAYTAIRCYRAIGAHYMAAGQMLELYKWSPDDDQFEIATLWSECHPEKPNISSVSKGALDPQDYDQPETSSLEDEFDEFQQEATNEGITLWAHEGGSDLTFMIGALNKPNAKPGDTDIAALVEEAIEVASNVDPYESAARKAGWITMADPSNPLGASIVMVNGRSGLDPVAVIERRAPIYDQAKSSWQDVCIHESIRPDKEPSVEFRAVGDFLAQQLIPTGETVCGPFGGQLIWIRYLPDLEPQDDPAIINVATKLAGLRMFGLG